MPTSSSASSFLRYPDSELVIGLVAPIGIDLVWVMQAIGNRLKQHFSFKVVEIRFSELVSYVRWVSGQLQQEPEAARIESYMNAGNEVRGELQRGDALALLAVNKIAQSRSLPITPERRTAYILRSLKHPDEVRAFRQVYGDGFFLLAIDAARTMRLKYLTEHMNIGKKDAERLIKRDEAEGDEFGQRTRDF
jgi:hypothetical protein